MWAKRSSRSRRDEIIAETLAASDCDVLCVTEGYREILPDEGHVIDAGQDWGYPIIKGRRKVLLWSKQPWTKVDCVGSEQLPNGRFVRGDTTLTSADSPLTVTGVCIPWSGAHVKKSGRKDRKAWEDHKAWLSGFKELRPLIPASRTVVLGDFNQRIPRPEWAPKGVSEALLRAFEGFEIATAGELAEAPGLSIDHIAHTRDLTKLCLEIWPKKSKDCTNLSDHFGVWGNFGLR